MTIGWPITPVEGRDIALTSMFQLPAAHGIPSRQCHAVGSAGAGVAAVDHDGLCIAVRQVGTVYLDGCAADLVSGVNTGGGAADVGLDERQIIAFSL